MQKQVLSISVAEWCKLAREGAAPPVKIYLDCVSMQPLIRRGKDAVTIIPLNRRVVKGDVVLFASRDGRYIVHRVWQVKDESVRTLGDGCFNPDPWMKENQILGLVARMERGGRSYRLDTPQARVWGRVWMAIYPLRRGFCRCRSMAARIVRRLRG